MQFRGAGLFAHKVGGVGSNEMTDPIPAVDLDQGTMPCRSMSALASTPRI